MSHHSCCTTLADRGCISTDVHCFCLHFWKCLWMVKSEVCTKWKLCKKTKTKPNKSFRHSKSDIFLSFSLVCWLSCFSAFSWMLHSYAVVFLRGKKQPPKTVQVATSSQSHWANLLMATVDVSYVSRVGCYFCCSSCTPHFLRTH